MMRRARRGAVGADRRPQCRLPTACWPTRRGRPARRGRGDRANLDECSTPISRRCGGNGPMHALIGAGWRRSRGRSACEQTWRKARRRTTSDGEAGAGRAAGAGTRSGTGKGAKLALSPLHPCSTNMSRRRSARSSVFDDLAKFLPGSASACWRIRRRGRAGEACRPFPSRSSGRSARSSCIARLRFDHGRLDISLHPFCGGVPAMSASHALTIPTIRHP